MLLGATEYTLCCTIQFTFQFIPDSTGWGLYSLITCSCQNTTSESHYFKFYHTRHLLFYLAIFFILPYPKPIIDCDSHKSLCCFPQEEIYRMEGRSGKNINQCWIILRSFLFLLFFFRKEYRPMQNWNTVISAMRVTYSSFTYVPYTLSFCYELYISTDPEDKEWINITLSSGFRHHKVASLPLTQTSYFCSIIGDVSMCVCI